ncbi:hypothetical protein FISHEDRAFT_60810 [Fistulina hepatica ATCC 64428]|uniref:Uncharacterized protein n=1 Tax=Fistulina hepatica ATCC 64428 TaxID=1128425 RepID=A0A0D7A5I5_9AGAR|nr:hypothetical protein FISHEDRAFT_60810 [Fistulina hepatica ATCC 64428]
MSVSVEDLVASLSSNHIGQEAIDLAGLQAQLAQVLFSGHQLAVSQDCRRECSQPCNTPTRRTPSSSFSFPPDPTLPRRNADELPPNDMDDEDERMVEDTLYPTSVSSPQTFSHCHPSKLHYVPNTTAAVESTSSFTTTDPFYLSKVQELRAPPKPTFFSQMARPSAQSPFIPQQQTPVPGQHGSYGYSFMDATTPTPTFPSLFEG